MYHCELSLGCELPRMDGARGGGKIGAHLGAGSRCIYAMRCYRLWPICGSMEVLVRRAADRRVWWVVVVVAVVVVPNIA